jgi:hypothetical protein
MVKKTYNSKVLLILLIGLMGLILCPVYVNAAPNPGHSAGEIGAGTFADSSPYTFPNNLNVNSNLVVSGSLGVGTSPTQKLDVAGNILCSSGITSAQWCSKDYDVCAKPRSSNYFDIRNKADNAYKGLAAQNLYVGASDTYIDGTGGYLWVKDGTVFDGSVGIGTTDPGTDKLKVAGSVNITSGNLIVKENIDAKNRVFIVNSLSVGGTVAGAAGQIFAGDLMLGFNDATATITTYDANEDLNINPTGDVGVGTDTPTQKLQVIGNVVSGTAAGGDGAYYLGNPSHGISRDGQNTVNIFTLSGGSEGAIRLNTEGSTRLMVTKDGNVGIGTTGPTQKLDVAGYVKGQSGLCIGNDCRNTWPAGAGSEKDKDTARAAGLAFWEINVYNNNPCSSGSYPREFASSDLTGTITGAQVCTNAGASCTGVKYMYAWGSGGAQGNWAGADQLCSASLTKDQIWPYTDMSYDAAGNEYGGGWEASTYVVCCNAQYTNPKDEYVSGNLMVNSNVGIGTTSPQSKLHVTGDAGVLILEGSTHAYIQWYPDGSAAGRKGWTGWENGAAIDFTIANEYSGGDIILSPNNGNVGIGTASPGEKLEVSGNIKATGSAPTLYLQDSANDGSRPLLIFGNNILGGITGTDIGNQEFGFYSKFSDSRTNNAEVKVFGNTSLGTSWGRYISVKHDGRDGIIRTDTGNIIIQLP